MLKGLHKIFLGISMDVKNKMEMHLPLKIVFWQYIFWISRLTYDPLLKSKLFVCNKEKIFVLSHWCTCFTAQHVCKEYYFHNIPLYNFKNIIDCKIFLISICFKWFRICEAFTSFERKGFSIIDQDYRKWNSIVVYWYSFHVFRWRPINWKIMQ